MTLLRTIRILIPVAILSFSVSCKSRLGQNIKADVQSKQNGIFENSISKSGSSQNAEYSVRLKNKSGSDQNLKFIDVTITPDKLLPDGIPYMTGADEMQDLDGHMNQLITGKSYDNDFSNMYLMFKRGDNDYMLVGVASWRTFLCKISTRAGKVIIQGLGDNKLVKAGEEIPFEKIVVLRDKSWQDLLDRYADVLVKENDVKKPANVLWKGWSTWDFYAQKFTDEDIFENVKALGSTKASANIIQIDGGWWKYRGDYFDVRDNLTGGIKGIIEDIHKKGYKAGLHFDGFRAAKGSKIATEHPEYFIHTDEGGFLERGRDPITKDPLLMWDYSHPGAQDYIRDAMKNARDNWKVDYFKIDFMQQGLYSGVSHLPVTNVERLRMGLIAMKEGMGDNVYFLACSSNFGTVVGLAEGNRMGGDIDPTYKSVMERAKHTSGSYYLAEKVFNLDPDYEVLRSAEETDNRDLKKPTLSYDEAVMWNNYVAIFGNARFNCDNITLLKPDRKKLIPELFRKPHFTKTIPIDLWDHYKSDIDAPRFYLARTADGKICIALFNWSENEELFKVSGFEKSANLTELDGDVKITVKDNRFQVLLKDKHSILLEYSGTENFDSLRNNLNLALNGE